MKSTAMKHKTSDKAATGIGLGSPPFPCAVGQLNDIATAAYYKSEARGFVPGQELDDWLEGEAECS